MSWEYGSCDRKKNKTLKGSLLHLENDLQNPVGRGLELHVPLSSSLLVLVFPPTPPRAHRVQGLAVLGQDTAAVFMASAGSLP